ncbi:MAG: hypothetical protein SFU86_00040 [Pirellulaceae bacterium]|nr:hypothetical protein [Pirellulaceae bacterium]
MDWTSLLGGMGGGGGGGGGKTTSSTAQAVIGSQVRGDQADVSKWLIGGGVVVVVLLGLVALLIFKGRR